MEFGTKTFPRCTVAICNKSRIIKVITVAFCNKTVAFCNKKPDAFRNKLLSHFVIK